LLVVTDITLCIGCLLAPLLHIASGGLLCGQM